MNEIATSNTVTKDNTRDYLLDNLRAIFIILVVWGHVLTSMKGESNVIKSLYYFVFFFHMPAMSYISGYFSKNLEKSRNKAFVTILVPFLILNVINYSYKMIIIKEQYYGFRFFRPYWGLWYLLALFLWKFFLKDIVKIRFLLPLSFLFALFAGFSKEFSDYMALGRTICFLPFFLLGYYCTKEHIDKIRRVPKLLSLGIVTAVAVLTAYIVYNNIFSSEVLYLRRPYPQDSEITFMLFRALVYVVAIAMIVALINLITEKKTFLSTIGTRTMTVYILHLFTIPILEKFMILNKHPYLYLIYSVIVTAIIVYVYTRPIVGRVYDAFINKITNLFMKLDR
jgi:fucose 4-O-acetylase-like acetyltransferase